MVNQPDMHTDRSRHDAANKEERPPCPQMTSWLDSPLIRRDYINPLISGSGQTGWFEWVSNIFFPQPVTRALSLGCGTGALEQQGLAMNVALCFDAYDISPEAIESARMAARTNGCNDRLNYFTSDLNHQIFPLSTYDVVFTSQALQHVVDLEHLFTQVERTLKPGGLFVINSFVGPSQFQWTDKQVKYALTCLEKIPAHYRQSMLNNDLKVSISRPAIASMNQRDPTLAIRSKDILPLLYKHFDVLERRDFGGTLLNLVLEDITGNFQDTPADRAVLKELYAFEQKLIRAGELSSDYTTIVAYRR